MKRKLAFTFALFTLITQACGPAAAELTATAEIAAAQTQTAAPTQTPTATSTPLPTETPTPSTGSLEIHAFITETGDPVIGLHISLGEERVPTDAQGSVLFANLSPGSYPLLSAAWIFPQITPTSCTRPQLSSAEWSITPGFAYFGGGELISDSSYVYGFEAVDDITINPGETTILELSFTCD